MRRRWITSQSPDDTLRLGREMGGKLCGGEVVSLSGSLGAGKSILCRGVGEALGIGRWKGSPTFTILNEYRSSPPLIHADLYRLTAEEVEDLGLEERVEEGAILLVEWGDRAEAYLHSLPSSRFIRIALEISGMEDRTIEVSVDDQRASIAGGIP